MSTNQFTLSGWFANSMARGNSVAQRVDRAVEESLWREYSVDSLLCDSLNSWFDVMRSITYPLEQLDRSGLVPLTARVTTNEDVYQAVIAMTPAIRDAGALAFLHFNRSGGTAKKIPVNDGNAGSLTVSLTTTSDKQHAVYSLSGLQASGVAAGEVYKATVNDGAIVLVEVKLIIVSP